MNRTYLLLMALLCVLLGAARGPVWYIPAVAAAAAWVLSAGDHDADH